MTTQRNKKEYLENGQPVKAATADKPIRRSREDFLKEQAKREQSE